MKKGFINKLKGVLASAAAVVMTVGMIGGNAIPAMAADLYGNGNSTTGDGYTITINGNETGHTYKAYQIFAGDLHEDETTHKLILSNIIPGSDLASDYQTRTDASSASNSLAAALKKNSDLSSITSISQLQDNADAATIAEAISSANITNKSAQAIALAKVLDNYIDKTGTHGKASAEGTNNVYTISNLKAGYYLVTDSVTDENKNLSQLVLEVVQSQTIEPKSEIPSLKKEITDVKEGDTKINDALLDTDGKAAVAKVGSTVSFKLTGAVPSTAGYSAYTYKITDTLSSGLDFVATADNTSNVGVYIGGTSDDNKLTSGYSVTVSGRTLTVIIDKSTLDAHQATDDAQAPAIYVTYDATVNATAVSYNFEKNTAQLAYSNNPQDTTTSKTTEQNTYVVNIDVNVNKVDSSNEATKVADAKFKLYRVNSTSGTDVNEYYKFDSSSNKVTWGTSQNGDEFITGTDGKLYTIGENGKASSTAATFKGLDKGVYYLEETEAPAGYNKISSPVKVEIIATETTTGGVTTVKYTFKVNDAETASDATNGTVTLSNTVESRTQTQPVADVKIANSQGTQLPSTGGIGTTIFYVIGGVVVAGAVILLLARRRKNA